MPRLSVWKTTCTWDMLPSESPSEQLHVGSQGEKPQPSQNTPGWGTDGRQDGKAGWHEDKGTRAETRRDKPGGGGAMDRPKPYGAADAPSRAGVPPVGAPMGGKWREDGDRILPRPEPANRLQLPMDGHLSIWISSDVILKVHSLLESNSIAGGCTAASAACAYHVLATDSCLFMGCAQVE